MLLKLLILSGSPYIHDHDAARMILIVFVSTCHEDLRPYDLFFEKTVENKGIDGPGFHNKAPKMSAKVVDVPARKNVAEKIPADDPAL